MHSGYTRKGNEKRRKRKTALERAKRIAKRIDANKALPTEAVARKRLSKKTVQAIEVANREKLAVEQLREIGPYLVDIAEHYAPILKLEGQEEPIINENADHAKFIECMRLGADILKALASYQSPKLQAILMQSSDDGRAKDDDTLHMTLEIFEGGKKIAEYDEDGREIDIESNLDSQD
jgi:hypothetical protein